MILLLVYSTMAVAMSNSNTDIDPSWFSSCHFPSLPAAATSAPGNMDISAKQSAPLPQHSPLVAALNHAKPASPKARCRESNQKAQRPIRREARANRANELRSKQKKFRSQQAGRSRKATKPPRIIKPRKEPRLQEPSRNQDARPLPTPPPKHKAHARPEMPKAKKPSSLEAHKLNNNSPQRPCLKASWVIFISVVSPAMMNWGNSSHHTMAMAPARK